MNKIMSNLEKFLVPLASKLTTNKTLSAISKGMMSMMGVMMVGAIATLIKGVQIDSYQQFLTSSNIGSMLTTIVNITSNLLAVYAVLGVSYAYVSNEEKDGFVAAIIGLLCFFLVTPMTVVGEGWAAVTNLPLDWLGAKGLFAAMIIAILVSKIYVFILNKNIVIKMPEGVPEFVSKSFVGIIPAIVITSVFALVSYLMQLTPFGNIHNLVFGLIQTPIQGIGTSIWAVLLVYTLTGICWFFGIHGMAVISVMIPIWAAADAENMVAMSQGVANADLPNIITFNWISAVGSIGGAGATIGLVIWLTFRSKSKQYKTFGKMAIIPSIFNINEPVVFGLPCMLNPILAIPFIFTPVLMIALAYVLVNIGILPISNGIGAPMGTPLILQGLVNGGWRLALFQVVDILISLVIYYPFFKILDKKAVEDEKSVEAIQA